ncbi:hypothetical protein ABPG74_019095 [Tetrahymena malaccensis]
MSQIQSQNKSQLQAQKQVQQRQQQQSQQIQVIDAQAVAQAQLQRAQEQHTQHVYKQIINEEKKVYGMKYPQRNTEPSMFDILSWEEKKQQKQDFKSNHIPNNEVDQYKVLINKSSGHFQTEQRDNYRQYYLDKEEGVLVPEVEPEVLDKLRGQQQQLLHEHHHHQHQPQVLTVQHQQQVHHQQQVNQAHQHGPKSSYQREYEISDVHNPNELINIIQKNHKLSQKQTEALLERAQQDKRSKIQVNNFYEQEPVQLIHPNEDDNDEDYEDEDQENLTQQQQLERQRLREQKLKEEEAKKEAAKIKKFSTVNTKNVKSKLIKYKPQAQKLDPQYQKERIDRRKQRIKHMEETTRWLPNSAFTTYFGKPAFENYGRGNVKPTIGGPIYGQYLLSHNVNPHRGIHQPKFIQSYNNALNYGERLPDSEPQPPRNVKEDFRLSQKQVDDLKNRNPLTATVNVRENLRIQKPDLVNSLRFASNENSPVNVANTEEEKRKRIKEELKQLREGTKAHTQSFTQFQDFADSPQKPKKPSIKELQGKVKNQSASQKQVKIQTQNEQQQQNQQKQQKHAATAQYQQQQQQQEQYQQVQQYHQYQPQQLTEDQIRANQEWANDLPHKRIIDELNRKKAQKNRLALKVTEVIPVLPRDDNYYQAGITSEKKNKSLSPSRPQTAQPRFDIQNLDLSGLPVEVQNELREKLNNPKLYKNAPAQFTKHIPYAGKTIANNDDIKSVFHYENVREDDF